MDTRSLYVNYLAIRWMQGHTMARSTLLKPATIETIDRVLHTPILQPIARQIRDYYRDFNSDAHKQQRDKAIAKLQRALHLKCND